MAKSQEPPTFPAPAPVYYSTDTHDPAPGYEAEQNIWDHWLVVERAHSRVTECQIAIAELEPKIAAQKKEYEKLKEISSEIFATLHKKPQSVVPTALKRLSFTSSRDGESKTRDKDLIRERFEAAHSKETSCMTQLEEMRDKIDGLKMRIQKDTVLASSVDQVWELLAASMVGAARNEGTSDRYEEEAVARMSALYDLAQKAVSDLTRARVTVQHVHHYYHNALRTLDAIRGSPLGRAIVGGRGEMSKNADYKVAVNEASKAQICFNETARVLEPHVADLPQNILDDFTSLKEMGLLQPSKIYGLMYGWQRSASGIGRSVGLMVEKQEKAFAHLTRLAVWIQDNVPVYEARLRTALVSRDQARRDLVAVWKRCAEPGEASVPNDSVPQ